MKFSLSSVLAAGIMVSRCAAEMVMPDNQASMPGREHHLHGDVHEHKNIGLGIQPRYVNITTENFIMIPTCIEPGKCRTATATKTSSAIPEVTVCKTCTRFTTVTQTSTTTAVATTTQAPACGGKTPCPAACPKGDPCNSPCGKNEEPCHEGGGGPKCCKKGGHGGHGGKGGKGGMEADFRAPQHPPKYYEPLYDEDGVLVKRPKNAKARDGALDLWSEEGFRGHRAIYGRTLNTCDTLETLTHSHMGFGKSAHLRWADTCCQLFSARGCNGDFMMLAGDSASLAPYDFENKVKSVRCMSADRCHSFYHNEEWKHHG